MEKLLEVRSLKTHFATDRGLFRAVDGISFSVPRGRTVGLVGESGCGKSVTSLSVMGLVPSPPGKVEAEAVLFGNRDVLRLSADERRRLRGSKMSMIFQEPMTSLNPVHTVGQQIVEAILAHSAMTPRSCVMMSTAMLSSACSSLMSARICAWIVTSSAVVGSSAISSAGPAAIPIAIIAR